MRGALLGVADGSVAVRQLPDPALGGIASSSGSDGPFPEAQSLPRSRAKIHRWLRERLHGARGSDFASSDAESHRSRRLRRTGSAPSLSGILPNLLSKSFSKKSRNAEVQIRDTNNDEIIPFCSDCRDRYPWVCYP
jgi:hypothetical protein